jgi:hypothetical protein
MPTYTQIGSAQVAGSGGAATLSFTSIPSTYTDLVLKTSLRGTGSLIYDTLKLTFNGSATGYSTRYLQGSGSAASSGSSGSATYIEIIDEGATATASTFSNGEIYIPNYAGSTNKSVSSDSVSETNATTIYMRLSAGLWSNSAAITSITLTPDASAAWAQYSTAYLYGVSNA